MFVQDSGAYDAQQGRFQWPDSLISFIEAVILLNVHQRIEAFHCI